MSRPCGYARLTFSRVIWAMGSAVLHGVGQNTEPLDLHFEDIAVVSLKFALRALLDTSPT